MDGGSANVSFSTIVLSILSYGRVSDSILLKDGCDSIFDGGGNLQFQSLECGSENVADPKLDSALLQNNGGPTPTIALQSDSPAIDQINTGNCVDLSGKPLMVDQRSRFLPTVMQGRCVPSGPSAAISIAWRNG